MEQRLSLVTLGVRDLARARAFYAALGWEGREVQDTVFFQAGGMVVALWSRQALAADSEVGHDAGGWGGITLAHNVRCPEEVDAVLEEAGIAGGEVLRHGAATSWGGYSGVFADPEGHRWEVAHNPFWTLTGTGELLLGGE